MSLLKKCIACTNNCDECDEYTCKKCANPYYLYNKKCFDSCPDNYYEVADRTCN